MSKKNDRSNFGRLDLTKEVAYTESMLATALIAFREFLEAFLIIGVFLGISKRLALKKEKEIIIASAIGIFLSLLLATGTYLFGDLARGVLTERNADALESYLLIFSGLFIAYVVFSLHNTIRKSRAKVLLKAHKQLQANVFDVSLFLTIVFLVLREGFEVALFTASTSLFAAFLQNFLGLLFGFVASSAIGVGTFFAYIKLSIGKVFRVTEYAIILLGSSLVQTGITKLLMTHFSINISDYVRFPLQFLPSEESLVGHALQSIFGIDRDFSLARLGIMALYFGVIYFLFLRKRNLIIQPKTA